MAYSRNNTKKAMSICDAIGSLLDNKDRLSTEIEAMVEQASRYMEVALARMQIEAAPYARERERELQPLLPMFAVDQATGEVKAVNE